MGGVCCAGRDDANAKATAKALTKDKRSKQNDIALFDEAFVASDVKTMVSLLTSNTKFVPLEGNLHPWAAQPKTVGALAMAQLSIMASKENAEALRVLKQKETLQVIVDLLASDDLSRAQGALVCLTLLTQDGAVCEILASSTCMELVVPRMESTIDGERSSAGQVCRNLFANVSDNAQRTRFVHLDGISRLLGLLAPGSDTDAGYTHLEGIYHFEDLCYPDGVEVASIVEEVLKHPILAALETLQETSDEETTDEIKYLLDKLSS
ncbi:MAG: hypothetical protein KVP17_003184 [Porospora cf. gigantea B]|uniref:uncharacterized protein n=1 Tax=Porospora cf. gigantea B TaxID=2853592 RepID=UPI003571F051|nr:MAG: hypothetical protein KVP17_003184 [Porospora cf. gigantea B]